METMTFFRVRGRYIENVEMKIYNRWGNLLFSGSGAEVKWDGAMNGSAVEAGIFTYHVIVRLTSGQILERSGNVMLMR
jgi:gliding motility-associated-like protein